MAQELAFSEATLGWRFSHTKIFLRHFIEQWELLQNVQLKNLDEYWNINQAGGKWLDQIGEVFSLSRPSGLNGEQFILDIDVLDGPRVLDGDTLDIMDNMFRMLLLIRNRGAMKLFTMPNIASIMTEIFGEGNIKVEFRENTDLNGNYKPQYFRILLTFKDSDQYRLFTSIQSTNPTIFFGRPMGVSYDIFCDYDPDL